MASTKVDFPILLVNLKTYSESLGNRAATLASKAEKVAGLTGVCVGVAPQSLDLRIVAGGFKIPVFAQHMDPVSYGKFTGHVLPEGLVDAGCAGTLINHSERRLSLTVIEDAVGRAREMGLVSVVCVDVPGKARKVARFSPDAVAIEPPELIGTGIPVSSAQPEIVKGAVEAVKSVMPDVRVLCGAGVTSGEDVRASLELGAEGVLVASGVVKAEEPYEKMLEFAEEMR